LLPEIRIFESQVTSPEFPTGAPVAQSCVAIDADLAEPIRIPTLDFVTYPSFDTLQGEIAADIAAGIGVEDRLALLGDLASIQSRTLGPLILTGFCNYEQFDNDQCSMVGGFTNLQLSNGALSYTFFDDEDGSSIEITVNDRSYSSISIIATDENGIVSNGIFLTATQTVLNESRKHPQMAMYLVLLNDQTVQAP